MSFQEVYEDVMKLTTNFTPVRRMIKAKIETLISKDYLKRDESDLYYIIKCFHLILLL